MTTPQRRYGWKPDVPDHRDQVFATPREVLVATPPKVDLRPQCPPIYDQGQLGSCTANAIAAAVEFDLRKQGLKDFVPSRLFVYWNERAAEGTAGYDSGAQLRTGAKVAAKYGACPEPVWPYSDADPGLFLRPPTPRAFSEAAPHRVTSYARVPRTLGQMRGCLAAGFPFPFGFTVYESFESSEVKRSGIVPMPKPSERALGGHAVACVGYDDATRQFFVRNSWGASWGQEGYCLMPYAYLLDPDLSEDFWTIRAIAA